MPRGRGPKECEHCGKTFAATSNRQTCCSIECRFLCFVEVGSDDACWLWRGGRTSAGYGLVRTIPSVIYAHRYACERAYGPAPASGMYAIHSCDNPPCCNARHLRWATPSENVEDMYAKGRQGARNYATGERHGMHRSRRA